MNKLRQISKEQGRSFDEVVREYAEEGKSRLIVAGLLGCDYTWFLATLRQRKLFDVFMVQQIRTGNKTDSQRWPKGVPRLSQRAPIERDGYVWHSCEPSHFYHFKKALKGGRP